MRSADLSDLRQWVDRQPAWSDLPFIILTQRGGGPTGNPAAARLADVLGNATFLERPFHPNTFAMSARSAYKARQRQHEARSRLEELDESQQRLLMALTAGRLGPWEFGIDSKELTASSLCKANFGRLPDDDFSYGDLLESIHADDLERMQRAVNQSIETGEDYNIEYRTIWPDDTVHWVRVNARVVGGPAGVPQKLVGVSADITARKAAEAELRAMNEQLELRVAERTAELDKTYQQIIEEGRQREQVEEQLRQAQKMEMIGQLTGGVAHDFNNLLMAVLTNLELLRKHAANDEKSQRLIDGAIKGANRGAALTQRLLAFSRRQSLVVVPTDVNELVRGMEDLILKSVGQQNRVHFILSKDATVAAIDGNQVELALLNLVVNARDAMPNGGDIVVKTAMTRMEDGAGVSPGDYVCLSVRDSGTGMDAATLEKAIQPFFSTKELGKGTGLGLSMIHGLSVQLNGLLKLSSDVGKGTTAALYFPATSDLPVAEVAPVAEPTAGVETRRARIMLVDDDVLIAMSSVEMLEDLGHEVIEANSGTEALEKLNSSGPVDLVITDFSMPGMTGLRLAEHVRELFPDMPILMATGYAELPENTELKLPRIGKPYTQKQLAREIALVLPSIVASD